MVENIAVVRVVDAPSDKVWAAIRAIGGLDRWFPVISSCRVEGEGVDAIRILSLADGGEMRDRIEEINDQARRFRYLRIEHPFPVSFYEGTVTVRDAGNGNSEVTWAVETDVAEKAREEFIPMISAALSDGIAGLERELLQQRLAS